MDATFFLRGAIIGFSIAAPVGPIGILCIRYTLTRGISAGLIGGLGAATADALYGCIAGFGLSFISNILIDQAFWLRLIGGIFLCYLGIKTFLAKPSQLQGLDAENSSDSTPEIPDKTTQLRKQKHYRNLAGIYASTLFLTLTNPLTIFSFLTIFAGLGLADTSGNYTSAIILVAGVFVGSAAWWLLLSSGVGVFRSQFNAKGLQWVNRLAGATIVVFGILALLHRNR